jgi:pyruvate formate lyase activating enzyme
MYEALFFELDDKGVVQCNLCPHGCSIGEGKTGICGVREHKSGKLFASTYGHPTAMHVDPIEKKPLYHFEPGERILSIGTFGCNLRCSFCQNYDISQKDEFKHNLDILKQQNRISPKHIIELAKKQGLGMVAFTYNEPTIFFEYMLDVAKLCKKNNIKTVLVSNGYINEEPLRMLAPYIDAANIDIKGTNDFYLKTSKCPNGLDVAKRTLNILKEHKTHLEITHLAVPDAFTGSEFDATLRSIREEIGDIPVHISRYFPHYRHKDPPTEHKHLDNFAAIARRIFTHVHLGNV